jgi:hypothetical protein
MNFLFPSFWTLKLDKAKLRTYKRALASAYESNGYSFLSYCTTSKRIRDEVLVSKIYSFERLEAILMSFKSCYNLVLVIKLSSSSVYFSSVFKGRELLSVIAF